MAENTEFQLDQSDLEAAIRAAVGQNVQTGGKQQSTSKAQVDDDNIGRSMARSRGSSQEKLSTKDELEKFFKQEDERTAEINYLEDDPDVSGDDDEDDDNLGEDGTGKDKNASKSSEKENKKGNSTSDDAKQQNSPEDDADEVGDTQAGSELLDIIREEGLLYIPDDFDGELTAEALDFYKAQTRLRMEDEIVERMRMRYADDPMKLQYFDYFMAAGQDADLPRYKSLVDTVEEYKNFDVTKEEGQRAILEQYLREGLDPNNPAHKIRLNKIKADVEDLMSNYEGEERAKEAQQYFVSKYAGMVSQEHQRIGDLQKQRAEYERQQQAAERQWHENFQRSLQTSKWSPDKQNQILDEQYGEVMTESGEYVPVWYAKQMIINNSPELYRMYLDFLSGFDLESGKFKNDPVIDDNTKVTRKILELAKRKQTPSHSHERNVQKPRTKTSGGSYEVVNPLDNL